MLGSGKRFENALQHDLDNFARMVAQAPPGALDPMSSDYLFHEDSAAAKGQTTERQDQTMGEGTSGQQAAEGNASWQSTSINTGNTGADASSSTGVGTGSSTRSATGYNTGTSAVSTDSDPTTGTATTWNDNTMAGTAGSTTTTGSAAEIANLNNPITAEDQEAAVGTEGASARPLDDNI